MLHLKFHHFSQGFDWECWILKKSKEKLSKNWKNQGRPTKSEIILDRVIIFWITPIWAKCNEYPQKYTTLFTKNVPFGEKKSFFGFTVICGPLFNGTLHGLIAQFSNPMNENHALCLHNFKFVKYQSTKNKSCCNDYLVIG